MIGMTKNSSETLASIWNHSPAGKKWLLGVSSIIGIPKERIAFISIFTEYSKLPNDVRDLFERADLKIPINLH